MNVMKTYEQRTGHVQVRHDIKCADQPYCMICDGGLFLCDKCGQAESELQEKCPGGV